MNWQYSTLALASIQIGSMQPVTTTFRLYVKQVVDGQLLPVVFCHFYLQMVVSGNVCQLVYVVVAF